MQWHEFPHSWLLSFINKDVRLNQLLHSQALLKIASLIHLKAQDITLGTHPLFHLVMSNIQSLTPLKLNACVGGIFTTNKRNTNKMKNS